MSDCKRSDRARLADSPWLWLLIFSLTGLGALAAIYPKYSRRQGGIERRFHARQRTNSSANTKRATADSKTRRGNSQSIAAPLWSVGAALVGTALFSIIRLFAMHRKCSAREAVAPQESAAHRGATQETLQS